MAAVLDKHPGIRHLKIEDGRGKRLGRSFRVKLWPNLVLMRDGQVVGQLVRPDGAEIAQAIEELAQAPR